MRRRALTIATAFAVFAGSAALSVAVSGTAVADSAAALHVTSVADMAVDGAHQRVYLSDPENDAIVVTDYSGNEVQRITGLDWVTGLALSADSSRLYAAVTEKDSIVAIDTANNAQVATYDLGEGKAPFDLAVAGSTVWFSYNDSGGHLGAIDPAQEQPTPAVGQAGGFFSAAPRIAVSPDGKQLAAGEMVTTNAALMLYDLSGTTATRRVFGDPQVGGLYDQLAFSPDGTQLVTASGSPYELPVYSTTDLSRVHTYPTAGDGGAGVAVSSSGTVAAGTSGSRADLFLYRPGGTEPIRTYEFGNTSSTTTGDTLDDGVLAWSPDGALLFAVSKNYDGEFRLHTYTEPNLVAPVLTVNAPSTATRAASLKVTGRISSPVAPLTAPVQLTVSKTDLENPNGKVLKTVTTAADGTYSFTDTPAVGGKVAYKVAYAGDAERAAVSATDTVEVSRSSTTLTLNKNKSVYDYGSDVTFTAHLGTTYKNRKVEIWSDPYGGDKPKTLVKSGTVNSSGNLSVTLDLTRDVNLSAVFAGDARYKPKTVSNTVYTRARASIAPSNHYKTGTIGSHTYYYFHKSSTVYATGSMNYYKGRKFRLDLQVYAGGAWRSSDSQYFTLESDGTTKVNMGAIGSAGYKFRIRADYINGTSGDNVNTTKYGSWKYLYSTN
ncbi:Ig-like domain repeat protein [Streptomyces sp. Q6]|uniref:Ig-like domain repeat protein n=1 Tax=Streptomyces citrinus TaxID=3118173 RepID=A0ACD5AF50_9ACTN